MTQPITPLPRRLVVAGTDTDVGKTLVSALLVQGLGAHYWKPVQCGGLELGGDRQTVAELSGCPPERLLPNAYALEQPASPNQAADAEGISIDANQLELPPMPGALVVETAGGLLVPFSKKLLQIDMICQWQLPVLLVARSGLGTLNHSLLSLEAMHHRGITVLGLVLNGPEHPNNRKTLEEISGCHVLACLPILPSCKVGSLKNAWYTCGFNRHWQANC